MDLISEIERERETHNTWGCVEDKSWAGIVRRIQIQKKPLKLVFKEYYPLFDKLQHNSYLSGGHTEPLVGQ